MEREGGHITSLTSSKTLSFKFNLNFKFVFLSDGYIYLMYYYVQLSIVFV